MTQKLLRTLGEFYLLPHGDLCFKSREYGFSMLVELDKYEVNKINSSIREPLGHV